MNHIDLIYRGAIRPLSLMLLAYVLPVLVARGCRDAEKCNPAWQSKASKMMEAGK